MPTNARNDQPARLRVLDAEISVRRAIEAPQAVFQSVCLAGITDGFSAGRNTGNTLYNLYRSASVRAARLPCRIWHWVPVKGRFYMGLVMVDSPGGVETVRWRVREQEIGQVVAARGDGRRHLYLFAEPFDFEFAETWELLPAADDLPYVIEGILYTPEPPEEQSVTLRAVDEVLAAPAWQPALLPDTLRLATPAGAGATVVARLPLSLPGLRPEDLQVADAAGTILPHDLVPLTSTRAGLPCVQQLQFLLPLCGATEQAVHLRLATGQSGPPLLPVNTTATAVDIAAENATLHFQATSKGLLLNGLTPMPVCLRPRLVTAGGVLVPTPTPTLRLLRAGRVTVELEACFTLPIAGATVEVTYGCEVDRTGLVLRLEHGCKVLGPARSFVEVAELALCLDTAAGRDLTVYGEDWTAPALPAATVRASACDRTSLRQGGDWVAGPELAAVVAGCLALAPLDFHTLFPAALTIEPDGLVYQLICPWFVPPELAPIDRDRLHFWHTGNGCRIKTGMMRRHRLLLAAADRLEDIAAQRVPPRALLPYGLVRGEFCLLPPSARTPPAPALRRFADRSLAAWLRQRTDTGAWGFFNYGDWFGERGVNWGNGEYDTTYGMYLQYLHSGRPEWLELAAASARHCLEVDTNHNPGEFQGWQYLHCMGHVGDYFPEGYAVGAYGPQARPGHAHTWVEGLLLHYLFTGDRLARWAVERQLDDMAGSHCPRYFSNGRDIGWTLVHLTAGATVLRRPDYLAAARDLVRLTLERQRQDGSWRRVLSADHCTCYPFHTGNAGFMLAILLEGLDKYLALTGDEAVRQAILAGTRFLVDDLMDRQDLTFRYTSCPRSPRKPDLNPFLIKAMARGLQVAGPGDDLGYSRREFAAVRDRFLGWYEEYIDRPFTIQRMTNAQQKIMSQAMRTIPFCLGANEPVAASEVPGADYPVC